jgi:hypothetical protein
VEIGRNRTWYFHVQISAAPQKFQATFEALEQNHLWEYLSTNAGNRENTGNSTKYLFLRNHDHKNNEGRGVSSSIIRRTKKEGRNPMA